MELEGKSERSGIGNWKTQAVHASPFTTHLLWGKTWGGNRMAMHLRGKDEPNVYNHEKIDIVRMDAGLFRYSFFSPNYPGKVRKKTAC